MNWLNNVLVHFENNEMETKIFLVLGAAGNFLCPANQLSYKGIKTGNFH